MNEFHSRDLTAASTHARRHAAAQARTEDPGRLHLAITIHNYRCGSASPRVSRNMTIWKRGFRKALPFPYPRLPLKGMLMGRHMPPCRYRAKFSGKYEHRDLTGGVGHNLPQEAPEAFARAVVDVDSFS
jgi:hypothetical protein